MVVLMDEGGEGDEENEDLVVVVVVVVVLARGRAMYCCGDMRRAAGQKLRGSLVFVFCLGLS